MTAPAVVETPTTTGTPAAGLTVREQRPLSLLPTDDVPVSQMILAAIERGLNVDALEKLVALKERIDDREAAKSYIRAMAAFKAELPPIIHSRKANFKTTSGAPVNYSYTELDELARVIDPVLAKHGFSYSWAMKFDKGMVTTTCTIQHIDGHSHSADFTVPAESNSAASPQQKIGIADTYAARRSLIAALGLTTADKDPRPAEIDPTPITEDQAIEITDLLKTRVDGKTKEAAQRFRDRFLEHIGVDAIEKIPALAYARAVAALQPKEAK